MLEQVARPKRETPIRKWLNENPEGADRLRGIYLGHKSAGVAFCHAADVWRTHFPSAPELDIQSLRREAKALAESDG